MNEKLARAKKYWDDNQTKILAYSLAATTTLAVIQHHGIKSLNNYLRENDLFDDYYSFDE